MNNSKRFIFYIFTSVVLLFWSPAAFPQYNNVVDLDENIDEQASDTIVSQAENTEPPAAAVDFFTVDSLEAPPTPSRWDTVSVDVPKMQKILHNYFYPPIETDFQYADTVILNSFPLPFVYYGDRISDTIAIPVSKLNPNDFTSFNDRIGNGKFFADSKNLNSINRDAYFYYLDNYIGHAKRRRSDYNNSIVKEEAIGRRESELRDVFKVEIDLDPQKLVAERYDVRKRHWLWNGKHYFQITQADNSTNWSDTTKTGNEKGIGAMNLVSIQTITGKYKKNKLEINHNMEWRLNVANSMNDTLRSIKIVEDRLRSYTTAGIAAAKHWNYSSFLEITTPLMVTNRENRKDTVSSFLSPMKVGFGIGMLYQLTKDFPKVRGKKMTFTADLSPLSLQNIFIKDYVVNPGQHGIKIGAAEKNTENKRGLNLFDFGSTINSNLTLNFNKYVSYVARLKYFTTYKKSYAEFENTLSMPINRYLSTRLYFYLTFDDSRVKNHKFGYFTINETVGLTFNFVW